MGVKYLIQQNLEILAEIYKTTQPAVAVTYLQKAGELKDSIFNENTCRIKENYAAMYESTQKQDTIKKQEALRSIHKMVL